jgi:beta-lactamase class A
LALSAWAESDAIDIYVHEDRHAQGTRRKAGSLKLAVTRLSKDIAAAIRGRSGSIAIRVEDVRTGVECRYNEGRRSHSASVVKATILAAAQRSLQADPRVRTGGMKITT